MQTSRKDNFKELTAEDIAAELLPLVREYFVGECRAEGGKPHLRACKRANVCH